MTVRAELRGHDFDLATLARLYPTGDPKIVVDDGRTYIEATDLGPLDGDAAQLIAVASAHLARMNGRALLDSGYRPVRLLNRFVDGSNVHIAVSDEARMREHVAVVAVTAEARLGALVVGAATTDGVTTVPAPDGPRQLARAAAHPDANDLLTLLGNANALDWVTLWKAMEIIRWNVGGTDAALVATGWVNADDLNVFGYTANNPAASGDDARHARRKLKGAIPNRTMTIEEGQAFIRDLARLWLDSLT
jgi:hypothetical protein